MVYVSSVVKFYSSPLQSRAMAKKVKAAVKAAKAEIKRDVKKVKQAKKSYDEFMGKVTLVVGVLGFVALAGLGALWLWRRLHPATVPGIIVPRDFIGALIIAVFCASFIGSIVVGKGQALMAKRTGRKLALVLFFVLPVVCLIATIFPSWTARTFGLPPMDANPLYPFWLMVRWYPPVLVAISLLTVFRDEAQSSRGDIRRKPALKFALIVAPYIAIMVFQELSLKSELLGGALNSTLGAIGINTQLILAVMTGSRFQ